MMSMDFLHWLADVSRIVAHAIPFLATGGQQQSRRAKFVLHVTDRHELCDNHRDKRMTHKQSGLWRTQPTCHVLHLMIARMSGLLFVSLPVTSI